MQDGPNGAAARERAGQVLITALASEWHSPGTALGYRYEGSPVIVPDGTPEPADDPVEYIPTTRPGHRAPHVTLADGQSMMSLFGRCFVLVRVDANELDTRPFEAGAGAAGVPLKVEDVDGPDVAARSEGNVVVGTP